jgi:multidrug efflux pump subunit AcrB
MRGFTLVFAGLAAAVAVIVDAVIDVDRLRPRLDERRGGGRRVSAAAVVPEGATETRSAMGNATAIVVLTPVPVVFIDGVTGAFVTPLVRSYLIAIVASMLVALIVTPALSLFLLSKVRGDALPSPLLRSRRWSSRAFVRRRFRRCSPARRRLPGSREV